MKKNITIQSFEFPLFRFKRLLYSVPLVGLSLWLFTIGGIELELLLEEQDKWISLFIYAVYLIGYVAFTIKWLFYINSRVVLIWADDTGFRFNIAPSKKIMWHEIKSCKFPRDIYEIRSQSPASTIILDLGFGKIKIINCSTWTIFSKNKRKNYNHNFESFKEVLRHRISCTKT
ncbi:hypothetical protein [Sinomicrobium sp.]